MKVAFLNIYNGVIDRGAETFVKELAGNLSSKLDVVVFQGGKENGSENYKVISINVPFDWTQKASIGSRLSYIFLDYWSRVIFLFTLKSLPQIIKHRYDIVVTMNGGWQPLLIRLITWLYGGKVVITGQSGPGWDDRFNLYTFPNAFVGLTENQCNWAKKINSKVKIIKIPNGVDTKVFKQDGENIKIPLKMPIVLSVGALIPIKRLDLAIKAVARLKGVSLVLVGDGEQKEELEKLGKELLPGRFMITKLPYGEMRKIYKSVSLFTYPTSPWESFGIVMLEAMASNLPVVASDDPIRREIVEDAGLFVNPENTDEYAEALEKALNIKWKDIPRRQSEKFAWSKVSDQYEALFKEILK